MAKMTCKDCGEITHTNWGDKENIYCSVCYWKAETASYAQTAGEAGRGDASNTAPENSANE